MDGDKIKPVVGVVLKPKSLLRASNEQFRVISLNIIIQSGVGIRPFFCPAAWVGWGGGAFVISIRICNNTTELNISERYGMFHPKEARNSHIEDFEILGRSLTFDKMKNILVPAPHYKIIDSFLDSYKWIVENLIHSCF
jgi:hypothetical protein